jgi:hypothetical protein
MTRTSGVISICVSNLPGNGVPLRMARNVFRCWSMPLGVMRGFRRPTRTGSFRGDISTPSGDKSDAAVVQLTLK